MALNYRAFYLNNSSDKPFFFSFAFRLKNVAQASFEFTGLEFMVILFPQPTKSENYIGLFHENELKKKNHNILKK